MTRDPRTLDCSIDGCTYAEYRAGLCRKHHAMIPLDVRLRSSGRFMQMMHEAGKENAAAMKREVEGILSHDSA